MESNGDRDRDRGEDAPTNGRRNEEEFERRTLFHMIEIII